MTPQQTIAHYRITSKLGEGGMGAVYRATDTKLNRDVAIKVLPDSFASDPDRLARFTREAQVLGSLNHPNIATIYGVEERAIVLELVEGPAPAGPLSEEQALPIIHQLIDALEYAHDKGIVHRDLKPANLKLTTDGRLKVLDFGLAKALSSDTAAQPDQSHSPTLTMRATMSGVIMGTAAYMSPEQARGHNVDKRADIWSFGAVVYELLTGRQLFGGETVSDTLAAVLKTDPDFSAVPQRFQRLLKLCLTRDPRQRLRDISGARLLLDDAPAQAVKRPRAMLWWAMAASLLAVGGVVLAFIHLTESSPEPAVVRFQVQPENAEFDNIGNMAVSPDGRRIAYVAHSSDGRRMLWLHALDSLTSYPIRGTEEALYLPFWSPDGRFIGFGAGNKLKKVEITGGSPQTLAEVPGPILGGTWNRDGVILFGYNAGALYRISQSGGAAARMSPPNEKDGEIGHLRPSFLPDGNHYLYYSRSANSNAGGIWIASLDGSERRLLVASRHMGAYAPPVTGEKYGHLLYLRDGTLLAQTMHPSRYVLTGEPVAVADQVGAYLAMGYFSVSANGVLAYRRGPSGAVIRQLVWFDQKGKRLETVGAPSQYTGNVALSPDGKAVAAERTDGGNADIWLIDTARGIPTRFTFDPADDRDPVWSRDASKILFRSDRQNSAGDLYVKQAHGSSNEQLLLSTGAALSPNSWSPDGAHILFHSFNSAGMTSYDLWTLAASIQPGAAAKTTPYLQTRFTESSGQFSPDGRWIAYASSESGDGRRDVFVQSFPPGNGKFQVSHNDGGTQPRWSRDGKQLFYLAPGGKLMASDVRVSPRFEADIPRALFDTGISASVADTHFRYDVAPDGRVLAATAATGSGKSTSTLTIVLNWQAGVAK